MTPRKAHRSANGIGFQIHRSQNVAQLVTLTRLAIGRCARPQLTAKPIHVISTDTLVENPIVAAWVNQSLVPLRIW